MQSKAATPKAYLDSLPADRRLALGVLRDVILKNLPKGFVERMNYGMLGYVVPHSLYPSGYHCDPRQPLPFASLASQKNKISIYLMSVYMDRDLEAFVRDGWAAAGLKLDMGKSCIRVKSPEQVPIDVLGKVIRRYSVKQYVSMYEAALPGSSAPRQASKTSSATARKTTKAKQATARKPTGESAGGTSRPARKTANAGTSARKPARKTAKHSKRSEA